MMQMKSFYFNHLAPSDAKLMDAAMCPLPDRIKPSLVIFVIQAFRCSWLSVGVPGWQKLQAMA